MEIYDGKEVFIIVDPDPGIADSPALWSNNRSLVALTQDYFDILWSTASEEPIIKPKSLSSKFTSH